MDNVISLHDRMAQKYGETSFMLCACQNDKEYQSGMLPVVMHDAQGPFICALVCPECEEEISVSFGRPQ